MKAPTNILRALFWCALAAEVGWLAFSAALDAKDRALAHLVILCALSLSSGLLLALEWLANTAEDPDHQRTLAETLYALVLFGSLFFGVYAFFVWYYSS